MKKLSNKILLATAKLCPDGLLFDSKNPNQEKCDYPFNVDCGTREYVRKLISIYNVKFL